MVKLTRLVLRVTSAIALLLSHTPSIASAQTFRCVLDRAVYLPGEPIEVALVYCPDSTGTDSVQVPPLHPQWGYVSLSLRDGATGRRIPMTSPIAVRVGGVPPEVIPRGECVIECFNLIHEFGTRNVQKARLAESLGLDALPPGRYKLRVTAHLPVRAGESQTVEQGFKVQDGPLPPSEEALVDKFVAGSPGTGSAVLAREKYCLKMFPEFAHSRYASYVYYRTGGLMREIPLERVLATTGSGPGSDVRRARLLLHRIKFLPVSAKELSAIVARHGTEAESSHLRLAARQIQRRGRP